MPTMLDISEIAAARNQQITDMQDEYRLIDTETPSRRHNEILAELAALNSRNNSITRRFGRSDEPDAAAEIAGKIARLQAELETLERRLSLAVERKARLNEELRRLQTESNPLPDIEEGDVVASQKRLAGINQEIAKVEQEITAENDKLRITTADRTALDCVTVELEDARAEALPEATIAALRKKQAAERAKFEAAELAMRAAQEHINERLAGLSRKADRLQVAKAAIESENQLLRAAFLQTQIRAARVAYKEAAQDFLKRLAVLAGLDRLSAENNCRIPVFADHRRGCALPGLNDANFEITDLDILDTADQLRAGFHKKGIAA